jgi:DNA-binding transcriptional ArsR family regulator
MTERLLEHVAQRLKAMGSPLRLRILHALEDRELTVTEILAVVRTTQANVSKHLTVLRAAGLVKSRRDGVSVHYGIADPMVLMICRTVCDCILRQVNDDAQKLVRPEGQRLRRARLKSVS